MVRTIQVYLLQMYVKDQVSSFLNWMIHCFSGKKEVSLRWAPRATTQAIAADDIKFHVLNLFSHDEIKAAALLLG